MCCKSFSYSWYCPVCRNVNIRTYPLIDEKLPLKKHEKCDCCHKRLHVSFASRRGVKYVYDTALREPEAGEPYSFFCLQCARILPAKWGWRINTPQEGRFMPLLHHLTAPKGEVRAGASASAGALTGSPAPEQASPAEGPPLPTDAPAEAPQSEAPAAQQVKLKQESLPVNEFRISCRCGACYHGYYHKKKVTLNFLPDEEALEEKHEAIEREARRKACVALKNRNAANARRRRLD